MPHDKLLPLESSLAALFKYTPNLVHILGSCRSAMTALGRYLSFLKKFSANKIEFRHSTPAPTLLAAPATRHSDCGQGCRRTAVVSSSDWRQVFEWSVQRTRNEFLPHRSLDCVTQVCPEQSAGMQTAGACSFASFACTSRKRKSPAGAKPGLCRWRRQSSIK